MLFEIGTNLELLPEGAGGLGEGNIDMEGYINVLRILPSLQICHFSLAMIFASSAM